MEHLFTTEGLVSLLTLTFLEIVLGIDNIVFISILSGKLPLEQQNKARTMGLAFALVGRILLLLTVGWIIGLKKPFFTINDFGLSFRDLILIGGGLFLIGKSVSEIHAKIEGSDQHTKDAKALTLSGAIIQIIVIDIVFSLDSILTAIGLVENIIIIIIAIVISLSVMLIFSKTISEFIHRHPAMKLLALSFLIMIGTLLVVEGLHFHVPRGYIYFSMAFAIGVEILNMKIRKKSTLRKDVDVEIEETPGRV
jgi:predicted tellurium resistance membrane protein TerC